MKIINFLSTSLVAAGLLVGVYFLAKTSEKEGPVNFLESIKSLDEINKSISECHEVEYMQNTKLGTDPCDDFYEFACGDFNATHQMPPDKSSFGSFELIMENNTKTLIETLSAEGPKDEIKPLKFARHFFARFTDEKFLEENDFSKLEEMDKQIRRSKTIEEFIVNSKYENCNFLFVIDVTKNPQNPTAKKLVYLGQKNTLPRSILLASDEKSSEIRKAYQKFINSSLKLFNPKMGDTVKIAKDILDLEVAMANISMRDEDKRDMNKVLRKFPKRELSGVLEGINLTKVIDALFLGKVGDDENVIVADVSYFKNLCRILKGQESVIKHMATFKILQAYGVFVSSKMIELMNEFEQVMMKTQKPSDRKNTAVMFLTASLRYIIGRLFIDSVGFDEKDRQRILEQVNEVKSSLEKFIDEKEWMDAQTKASAKEKLIKMKLQIGYPEWIKNDDELTKSFNVKLDEADDTLDMIRKINYFKWSEVLRTMDIPSDPERDWVASPAEVNAFYEPGANTLVFPAGILRGILYKSACPNYINYAAIGGIIGHEITHAFDDRGSQYDADGALVNWFSNESLQNFHEVGRKMADLYSSIKDERVNMNLNGILGLGENIADNGGLRGAYEAYFRNAIKELKLLDFEMFTAEQMFFLAFANSWCQIVTGDFLRLQIMTQIHSPNKFRVNIPLSNFEEFAKAYNCTPESKMNPKNKVRVW